MSKIVLYKLLPVIVFFFIGKVLLANSVQADTNKLDDVTIVKDYTPTISDAQKISLPPTVVEDTFSVKQPSFKYYFIQKPVFVPFSVQPIEPAKMLGEPLTRYYHHYVKMGFGTAVTPMFDYWYNSLRSKNLQYGIHVGHYSFNKKLKLNNANKISAGYSNNEVQFYGKKLLRNRTLGGNINFDRKGLHYYGINPNIDTIPEASVLFHRYMRMGMELYSQSHYLNGEHLNHNVHLHYNYFQGNDNTFENALALNTRWSVKMNGETYGADINGEYYNQNIADLDTANNRLITIAPWILKIGNTWRIRAGLKAVNSQEQDSSLWYFYPNVILQYNIIENLMIPYVGFDGDMKTNQLSALSKENLFINPRVLVRNENNFLKLYGGFKGAFTKSLFYDVRITYSLIDNAHFFVTDTSLDLQNQFAVVYDNVELFNIHAELAFKTTKKWYLLLRSEYNKYTMNTQLYPWQKPELLVSGLVRYNLRDKIYIGTNVFYMDKRYAMSYDNKQNIMAVEMSPIWDVNINLEYRLSKFFSGFLNFNNILGHYDAWYAYPTMGFNVMGGITYSF